MMAAILQDTPTAKCGIYRKAGLSCVDLFTQFQRLAEGFTCPLMGHYLKSETSHSQMEGAQ